jgi:hypothetical protein
MAMYMNLGDMLRPDEWCDLFSEFDDESTAVTSSVTSGEDFDMPQTPQVLKNDIRRHFSNTFVNSVNSGSLDQIQALSKAFIGSQCATTWYLSTGAASKANIPVTGTVYGPAQFLHFVLGAWVTFPDVVLSRVSSRIFATAGAPGRTTLMLNVNIAATRTSFLLCDLWLPPMEQLPAMYAANTAVQLRATVDHFRWLQTNASAQQANQHFSNHQQRPQRSNTVTPHYRNAAISEQYVYALHQSAVPVQPPVAMQLNGHFCFDFDEQNKIVQISLCIVLA